jgi:L-aminopeptidase/D-esterase-like protein
VPGAIVFDLLNGGDKAWGRFAPYREFGYQAAATATTSFALGSVGDLCGRHSRRRASRGERGRQRHGRRWSVVLGRTV